MVLNLSEGSFTESFIKIQHQEGGDFKSRNAFDGGTPNIPMKLYLKFHQDPTSESLSRLHLSSKSCPGKFLMKLEMVSRYSIPGKLY